MVNNIKISFPKCIKASNSFLIFTFNKHLPRVTYLLLTLTIVSEKKEAV